MPYSVKSPQETADQLEKLIKSGERFAFVRFGDGEILLMDGWKGKERQHFNSPELQKEMQEAFSVADENFMMAMTGEREEDDTLIESPAYRGLFGRFDPKHNKTVDDLIEKYKKRDTYWTVNTLPYLAVYRPTRFVQLMKALKNKKVAFVGPRHLMLNSNIKKAYNVSTWISAPAKQAYYELDHIEKNVRSVDADIVLIALGCASNILQKRLWKDYKASTIDTGSISDALAGNFQKRGWMMPAIKEIQHVCKML